MAFDSTANLLFTIGANSDDAEENIQRFRKILSTDFDEMGAEIEQWTKEVFGSLDSAAALAAAGTATLAAGVLAVGAVVYEAAEKYAQYVEEIERASTMTNIGVETMSGLHLAAQLTGTSFETLSRGIAFFQTQVDKANQGQAQALQYFRELGVSQAQLAAGETDIIPLLDIVAQKFHNLGSGAERAAIARGLFSRSGIEDQKVLDLLAQGIEKVVQQAKAMGIAITEEDVVAMEKHQVAAAEMKAVLGALGIEIGRVALPAIEHLTIAFVSFLQTLTSGHVISGMLTGQLAADWATNFGAMKAQVDSLAEAMKKMDGASGKPMPGVEQTTEEFRGLSNMLEAVKGKMADTSSEEAKLGQEMNHLVYELRTAREELDDKKAKLAPAVYQREVAAWQAIANMLPGLYDALNQEIDAKRTEAADRWSSDIQKRIASQMEQTRGMQDSEWAEEIKDRQDRLAREKDMTVEQRATLFFEIDELDQAHRDKMERERTDAQKRIGEDLDRQIEAQQERSYTTQVAALERLIAKKREEYAKEGEISAENEAKLEALRQASLARIDADQAAAYAKEMDRLQEHLGGMFRATMTHDQQMAAEYQKDMLQFGAAEEAKVLATAQGAAQTMAVLLQFEAMRAALFGKYQADLQQLHNSQGWQGVFGNAFASGIRGNEALLKEWAQSSNQAMMLVRVSLESLAEMGEKAFDDLARGMGQNIAHAIIYQQSIGAAMRQALVSTIESIASQSITYAIYSTALGFLRLAEHDYEAAGKAFTAAAVFGGVGVTAAAIGRAVAPPQAGAGASAGASGSASAGTDSGAAAAAPAGAQGQNPRNNLVLAFNGPIYGGPAGINELAAAINDAVLNRNVQLTATNTTTGQVVRR